MNERTNERTNKQTIHLNMYSANGFLFYYLYFRVFRVSILVDSCCGHGVYILFMLGF